MINLQYIHQSQTHTIDCFGFCYWMYPSTFRNEIGIRLYVFFAISTDRITVSISLWGHPHKINAMHLKTGRRPTKIPPDVSVYLSQPSNAAETTVYFAFKSEQQLNRGMWIRVRTCMYTVASWVCWACVLISVHIAQPPLVEGCTAFRKLHAALCMTWITLTILW